MRVTAAAPHRFSQIALARSALPLVAALRSHSDCLQWFCGFCRPQNGANNRPPLMMQDGMAYEELLSVLIFASRQASARCPNRSRRSKAVGLDITIIASV